MYRIELYSMYFIFLFIFYKMPVQLVNITAFYDEIEIQCKSVSGFLFALWRKVQLEAWGPWAWGRAMGCGGSRTDALEPRYLESWTKETESTWLTSTDTDIPLSSIQSIPSENSEADFAIEKTISPGKNNQLRLSGCMN